MAKSILISLSCLLCWFGLAFAATDNDSNLFDPTRPIAYQDAGAYSGLVLTSIFIYHDTRRVIINNQSLHVGDQISNNKVVRIDKDSVTLDGPDGEFVLPLVEGVEKEIIKAPMEKGI